MTSALLNKIVLPHAARLHVFTTENRILHVMESYHDWRFQAHVYIVSPKRVSHHFKQKFVALCASYGSEANCQELKKWTSDQLRPIRKDWMKA